MPAVLSAEKHRCPGAEFKHGLK